MAGLKTIESASDGAVSSKKCMNGDGQIYIESDERNVKQQLEASKGASLFKKGGLGNKHGSKKRKRDIEDDTFVALLLDKTKERGIRQIFATGTVI